MELKASSFFNGLFNKLLSLTVIAGAMAIVSLFWYGALVALLAAGVVLLSVWALIVLSQVAWAVAKKVLIEMIEAIQKISASVNSNSSVGEENFTEDEGAQDMDDVEEGDEPDPNEGMRIAAENGALATGFRSRRI